MTSQIASVREVRKSRFAVTTSRATGAVHLSLCSRRPAGSFRSVHFLVVRHHISGISPSWHDEPRIGRTVPWRPDAPTVPHMRRRVHRARNVRWSRRPVRPRAATRAPSNSGSFDMSSLFGPLPPTVTAVASGPSACELSQSHCRCSTGC